VRESCVFRFQFDAEMNHVTAERSECSVGIFMSCEEKARLTQEYDIATGKFAEAVRQLQCKIGTSTRAEYHRLQRISDEARVKSEQARLALAQHMAAHDC
jgi:hypothetical protein